MMSESVKIIPFSHRKITLNIKVSDKKKFDKNKQVRALMPNLIHSLDAASLALLHKRLLAIDKNLQFYSVHDCFGITADKAFITKTRLVSVYIALYSEEEYLKIFDDCIIKNIKLMTNCRVEDRTVYLDKGKYVLHDIDWVYGNKEVRSKDIKEINYQFIII